MMFGYLQGLNIVFPCHCFKHQHQCKESLAKFCEFRYLLVQVFSFLITNLIETFRIVILIRCSIIYLLVDCITSFVFLWLTFCLFFEYSFKKELLAIILKVSIRNEISVKIGEFLSLLCAFQYSFDLLVVCLVLSLYFLC